MNDRNQPERRPTAVERMILADIETFGADVMRGLTDRPERREPTRGRRQPFFERPTSAADFD